MEGFRLNAAMVSEAGAFLVVGGLGTSFPREYKRFVTPYVLRVIAIFSKPGWFEEAAKVRQYEAMETAGINGWQGPLWSKELEGKGLHGARGLVVSTVWSRDDPLFPAHQVSSRRHHINSPSIYKHGIMLVLKGVLLLRDHLYCCNGYYMDESNGIQKFASLGLAHSCRYLQRVLVYEGLPPGTHA